MGPIQAITTCFRKYATFKGRASRSEYWWFGLFIILMGSLAFIIDHNAFNVDSDPDENTISPILLLFSLATLLPSWAVAVRRMQDIGQNGKLWFWALAVYFAAIYFTTFLDITGYAAGYDETILFTVITFIVLFFLLAHILLAIKPSQPTENTYGPNPHEVTP